MPKPSAATTRFITEKLRLPKISNGTSGSSLRFRYSSPRNTASRTTPPAITIGIVTGPHTLPQSWGCPSMSPNVIRNSAAVALRDPERDELTGALGEAARHRRQREEHQADQEEPLRPVQVAEAAGGDQQDGVHQDVRVQHPQDLVERRVQLVDHVGDRDVHDRGVQEDHEEAEAERDEHQPRAVPRLVDGRCRRGRSGRGHAIVSFGGDAAAPDAVPDATVPDAAGAAQVSAPPRMSSTSSRTQASSARRTACAYSISKRSTRSRPLLPRVVMTWSYPATMASRATLCRSSSVAASVESSVCSISTAAP